MTTPARSRRSALVNAEPDDERIGPTARVQMQVEPVEPLERGERRGRWNDSARVIRPGELVYRRVPLVREARG